MTVALTYRDRMLADGNDKGEWMRVRATGITATDVARLSSPSAIPQAALEKLHGSSFTGNAYTRHGQDREPVIAACRRHRCAMISATATAMLDTYFDAHYVADEP